MKKSIKYLVMLLILLASTSSVLIAYSNLNNRNIDKNTDKEIINKITFNISSLSPGEKKSTSIEINENDNYTLYALFTSESDSKLDDYIIVEIKDFSYKLKDLFNKKIEIGKDIKSLEISYLIDINASNDSQNLSSSFNVYLEVSR